MHSGSWCPLIISRKIIWKIILVSWTFSGGEYYLLLGSHLRWLGRQWPQPQLFRQGSKGSSRRHPRLLLLLKKAYRLDLHSRLSPKRRLPKPQTNPFPHLQRFQHYLHPLPLFLLPPQLDKPPHDPVPLKITNLTNTLKYVEKTCFVCCCYN